MNNINELKEWYQGLAKREQQLTLAASIVIVIGLIFQLVISPINKYAEKAERNLTKKQDLLVLVKESSAKLKQLKASGQTVTRGSLNQIVPNSARNAGITISGTRPQGEELQVQLEQIEFNKLLNWLEQLSTKNGLRITAIDINAGDDPGTVNVRRLQLAK